VILSAYATTGATWPAERNRAADRALEAELREEWGGGFLARVTGFSPSTGHAEPSWATDVPFEAARELGVRYHQDALYVVDGDTLSVAHCDPDRGRGRVRVGSFRERLVRG